MKKLSRILALVLSLMMVLGCCAVAENTPPGYDSTIYTLSIYDPVLYYNDEPMIDLTGANLDLSAIATDTGLFGLMVDLFAGENYDYITGLIAQIDSTGATAYLDGMSDVYNADISLLTGINPYFYLSSVPLRTMLNSIDLSAIEAVEFTPEMRVAMAAQLFTAIAGDPDGSTYPISITAEQGRALLEALADYIAQVDADTAQEYRAALAEDPAMTFTLDGSMTYNGSSILVEMNGALTDSADSFPFSLKYSDDMSAIAVDVALLDAAGATIASLTGQSVTTVAANGRSATDALFTLKADGEDVASISYTVVPVEDSAQVDHTLAMEVPAEDGRIEFLLSTDTVAEGIGFNTALYAFPGDEAYGFGLIYEGDDHIDSEGVPYHLGYPYFFLEYGEESYALSLALGLQKYDASTADWALPTEGTVDVLTMDESQQQAALMDAMTVLQNVLPTLMEAVPGLNALMGTTEPIAE